MNDLESGHVAVELVKQNAQLPTVSPEAWDVVKSGIEVTVVDPSLRKLVKVTRPNGIHKVDLDVGSSKKDSISDGEANG